MNKALAAGKQALEQLKDLFLENQDVLEEYTSIYNRFLQLQVLEQAIQQHMFDNLGLNRAKVKALVAKVAFETLTEKVVPYVRKIRSSSLLNKLDYTEEDFLEIEDDEFPERMSDYTAEIDMVLPKLRELELDQEDLDLVDLGVETFELIEEPLRDTPEKAKTADANAERYLEQATELLQHVDELMALSFEATNKALLQKYANIRKAMVVV
jgi:hypothetical protein